MTRSPWIQATQADDAPALFPGGRVHRLADRADYDPGIETHANFDALKDSEYDTVSNTLTIRSVPEGGKLQHLGPLIIRDGIGRNAEITVRGDLSAPHAEAGSVITAEMGPGFGRGSGGTIRLDRIGDEVRLRAHKDIEVGEAGEQVNLAAGRDVSLGSAGHRLKAWAQRDITVDRAGAAARLEAERDIRFGMLGDHARLEADRQVYGDILGGYAEVEADQGGLIRQTVMAPAKLESEHGRITIDPDQALPPPRKGLLERAVEKAEERWAPTPPGLRRRG